MEDAFDPPQRDFREGCMSIETKPAVTAQATAEICKEFQVPPDALLGKSRVRHVVEARFALAYVLWKRHRMTLSCIAETLGLKDHSSAYHAVHRCEDLQSIDPNYKRRVWITLG